MRHNTFFRVLVFVGLIMTALTKGGYAQTPNWNPGHSIGTSTGNYAFNYNQTPDQLVEIQAAAFPNTGLSYQWESSQVPVVAGFSSITTNGTQSSYTIPAPFTQTMYYRRKTMSSTNSSIYVYSNIVKISLVSVNWEDLNYIRVHTVDTTNITDWKTVDQLPIGEKLQTTTYMDGLGRSTEKIHREMATPASGVSLWGDIVQIYQYDPYGREALKYLPYTTSTQSGKFKTTPLTEQPSYYTNTYSETSAFDSIRFDGSPMNRMVNIRQSGTQWAASPGDAASYDVNSTADSVQLWAVDYVQGDAPVNMGAYAAGSLYKLASTDVNGSQVVEYLDLNGRIVLKKVQVATAPATGHAGWSCTYIVYDDFGLLRYQIQPVGVQYLAANAWSFAGTNGATVLAEQCFQYNYDSKGHMTWKKVPGATGLNMLYDIRDRVVFAQDGNQAALPTPQWNANLYDELDRPVMTVLYNTTETISALQTDINNAVTTTTVNIPAYTQAQDNPVYDSRNTSIPLYTATQSISFVADAMGNFQSGVNDQFVAEINPSPSTAGYSAVLVALGNPISPANLGNPTVANIIKYYYYDNYSFSGAKSFNTSYTNTSAYGSSDPDVLPIAADPRTLDMPTGARTEVLGTSTYLVSTDFYDAKGRDIQTLEDNIKTGVDITTRQFHFDGRMLSRCSNHTAPGTGYTAFIILTKNIFDKLGRLTSIQKQYGSNVFKTVSSYDYDDMGRNKTKHLDPTYNNPNSGGPDLESLSFSYNLHGQLTGINKDYALKTAGVYSKWGHFFGQYLGYDNKDNVFVASQLDGQVTGQLWNTLGDDAQRKYDYSYDKSARLTNATFNQQQHPGDGWSNNQMDFSTSGAGGQITYDLNGNLLSMTQKGVMPGTATPVTLDSLQYTYNSFSNKLQSVTDRMSVSTANGLSGDFKDGANAAGTADYVYDADGNVVVDLNKNAQSLNNGAAGTNGIHYNFLDKPDQIRVVGKGTVEIVYSADGAKLQRAFIPEAGGPSIVTSYINGFVYQSRTSLTLTSPAPFLAGGADTLSYINFEEGRIRVMTPTSQNNGWDGLAENGNITLAGSTMGVWDYFIMDYQQNVRMILTEETHSAVNTCTMELGRAGAEDPVFGQTGAGNEVEATRTGTPSGWQSVNTSASVSQLGNLIGHTIGPNTLQKVMAGDSVTATVQYYYASAATSSNPNIIPNILNSLAAALGGNATAGTLVHGNGSAITSQLGGTPGFVNAVEPSNATSGPPQAYLTILFFDERFNFISAADGGVAQQQVASTWTSTTAPLGLMNIKAPKNGYAFVYVSNRSDQTVYFDNLAVGIHTGNIIEENHYYAFGLRIAGISSRKLGDAGEGTLKNNYLYNDKELFDDGSLNWYDFGYRDYDPQIGRFAQMDPLSDIQAVVSPYQYAFNDPVTNTDKNGLIGIPCPGTSAFTIFLEKAGEALSAFLDGVGDAIKVGISSVSPALQFIDIGVNVTNTALHVETVVKNVQLINGQTSTIAVGRFVQGGPNAGGSDGPGDDDPDPFPTLRIFWAELVFPEIMEIDMEYASMSTTIARGESITMPGQPGYRFLVFHYTETANHEPNRNESKKANRPNKNPDSKIFQMHEVAYASTQEGGANSIRRPATIEQNRDHGIALQAFYRGWKMKEGDVFYVPLIQPYKFVPVPVPQADKVNVKKPIPLPVVKPDPLRRNLPKPRPPILLPPVYVPTPLWEEIIEGILEGAELVI